MCGKEVKARVNVGGADYGTDRPDLFGRQTGIQIPDVDEQTLFDAVTRPTERGLDRSTFGV